MHVSHLSFAYGDQPIFSNFSFSPSYPITCIIGPPGCGKTTLLRLIAGSLTATSCEDLQIPQPVGLVFQEPTLLPWLSGIDNITRIARVDLETLHASILFPIIEPFARKRACHLSFGQRRLIELTRMILFSPPIICLDEPFNFLDAFSREAVLSQLVAVSTKGPQILITAHDEREVSDISGEVLSLSGVFPVSSLATARSK